MVINVVFRQIKAGKVTINTSTEFCRAANNHVPSMKPLFQGTNDVTAVMAGNGTF